MSRDSFPRLEREYNERQGRLDEIRQSLKEHEMEHDLLEPLKPDSILQRLVYFVSLCLAVVAVFYFAPFFLVIGK